MNIVIVGGGVMGRLWTGLLTQAGNDVTIIDASPAVVGELNERGVWIEQRDGSVSHVLARATVDGSGLGPADIVFFFVKTEHTADSADRAGSAVGPDTAVATLQNGFGNAEALAARFPAGQIVYGPTEQGGSLTPEGRVVHAHTGDTAVGPFSRGDDVRFATRVAGVLRDAGLEATALADVTVPLWQKRIFAAAVLPVAALTGLHAGELLDSRVFPAVAALAAEAVGEANADGGGFDLDEELQRITARLKAGTQAKASMLQDIQAHRLTEVDAIAGAIAELAAARGAVAPANTAVTALVHGRELAWQDSFTA